MEEIIQILMRRDDISYNEACNIVDECLEALRDSLHRGNLINEFEEIIYFNLGLEPDYFDYFLNELI